MAIVRQEITADGDLLIVGPGGREWLCTKQIVQDFYRSTSGSAAKRRADTFALVKGDMVAALGAEAVDPEEFFADFDVLTGGFKHVEWTHK